MNNSRNKIVAIIPAGGMPNNILTQSGNLPDAMVPINCKPVIGYIIEDLIERGIRKVFVILNSSDEYTESYLKNKFKDKLFINVIYQDFLERGVGYAVYLAVKNISRNEKVLVYLGDTIYKGKLTFNENALVTSNIYEESTKWCFVENKKEGLLFIDKPKNYLGEGKVLCGLYFFKKGALVRKVAEELVRNIKKIEMSDILTIYSENQKFKLVNAKRWYDCGNIENYYKAKIDFLKVRHFNKLIYNDLFGSITKSSNNSEDFNKIDDEINWYLNLPQDLQIFAPRLIDYRKTKRNSNYSLEFYGYQSLADLFVFNSLDLRVWTSIIKKLFEIIEEFRKYKVDIPYKNYYEMYYVKTIKRIEMLEKRKYWQETFSKEYVLINGNKIKNIKYYLDAIKVSVKKLYTKKEMAFIHGDLCLGNILFDPTNKIFKFIDPRGSFGKQSVYGDLKYDLGKLRHSFHGLYDFITSDLFTIKKDGFRYFFLTWIV